MKWKEFFASTLPRSKKSRRKSSKHTLGPETNGASSSPETDDVVTRNQKLRADAINGNKKKKRSSSVKGSDQLTQIAYNRQLVSPDFKYFGDGNRNTYMNPCGHSTLSKTSSNTSESGFEDGYEHYHAQYNTGVVKWCCSAFDTENRHQPDLLPNLNHTFPRERTRIKTNPWVTSHSKTMTSSLYSDNQTTGDGPTPPFYLRDTQNNDILMPISPNSNSNNGNYRATTDSDTSDADWFGRTEGNQPVEYPCDSPVDEHEHFTEDEQESSTSIDPNQTGVVEGGQLVINLKTGDIFVKPKPVFSPISFQYEDDLEATLERDLESKNKKKSRKRREDEFLFFPEEDVNKDWNKDHQPSREGSDIAMDYLDDTPPCSDRDTETCDTEQDGTLTKTTNDLWTYKSSNTKSFRKRGLRQRDQPPDLVKVGQQEGDSSPYKNMYYKIIDENQTKTSKSRCEGHNDVTYECTYHRENTDSAYDSSTLSSLAGSSLQGHVTSMDRVDSWPGADQRPMTLPGVKSRASRSKPSLVDSKRSLEDIHSSLKDKVERLRAEKRIVDQKVKQAREEEEIRREEKARIQKEVSTLRKQVLLKTLQELKDNLEDQSHRLQEAYDDILDMQWINAKLRRMRNTTL